MYKKYQIAHHVNENSELSNRSKELTSLISSEFGIEDSYKNSRLLIPIKMPFYANDSDIEKIKRIGTPFIEKYLRERKSYEFDKLCSNGKELIYLGPSKQDVYFSTLTEMLCNELWQKIPDIQISPLEPIEGPMAILAKGLGYKIEEQEDKSEKKVYDYDLIFPRVSKEMHSFLLPLEIFKVSLLVFDEETKTWLGVYLWE